MHTSSLKKKKSNIQYGSFFQKKPQPSLQRDLLRLRRAYHYLSNTNPSGDSKRKQMRGIQLAQQLVDPHLNTVQAILSALADKINKLETGIPLKGTAINEAEDNCRRYPREFKSADFDAAWLHYVNCLMGIPEADSIIETDVYNYAEIKESIEVDEEEEGEENLPEAEPPNDNDEDGLEPTTPSAGDAGTPPGFFARLFNRFRRISP